jgi:hypothetical protein
MAEKSNGDMSRRAFIGLGGMAAGALIAKGPEVLADQAMAAEKAKIEAMLQSETIKEIDLKVQEMINFAFDETAAKGMPAEYIKAILSRMETVLAEKSASPRYGKLPTEPPLPPDGIIQDEDVVPESTEPTAEKPNFY